MKKTALVISLAYIFVAANSMADDVTATATASWHATATKDTTSILTVTPLHSLTFKYSEGLEGFNTQSGAFDVTIKGQETATDFKLEATLISNTLISRSSEDSTLGVGVEWRGKEIITDKQTLLVDKSNTSGLESLMYNNAYKSSGRVSSLSNFNFFIKSGTKDGKDVDLSGLPDGYWDGDVKVQFTATWTKPSA